MTAATANATTIVSTFVTARAGHTRSPWKPGFVEGTALDAALWRGPGDGDDYCSGGSRGFGGRGGCGVRVSRALSTTAVRPLSVERRFDTQPSVATPVLVVVSVVL